MLCTAATACIGTICAAGKYGMQGAISAAEAACTDCEAGKYSDSEGVFITLYSTSLLLPTSATRYLAMYTRLISPTATASVPEVVTIVLGNMYVYMYVCMYLCICSMCMYVYSMFEVCALSREYVCMYYV